MAKPKGGRGAKASRLRGSGPTASGSERPADLFTTLARTGLFLDALQRECFEEHGLTFAEFSVLRLLQSAPGKTSAPSALAKEIVCTTGAMTKLVDRLERTGLVRRRADETDRRRVLVSLTASGRTRATRASAAYRTARERVLDRIPVREQSKIESSLSWLLAALEQDRIED